MKFEKFAILPAVVTMFDKEGNFDERAQRKLVKSLLDKKAEGFYIGGATGEGFMMTVEERKKVLETCIDEIGGKVPAIAYTGCNDTKTAKELSKFAERCGADAVSSVPPYYGGFSYGAIKKYYTDVAESVNIPLMIYTNLFTREMSEEEIKTLCGIPNCIGIKYTNHNHYKLRMLTAELKDKLIFSGADEMIGSAMIAGATGAIGTTYNIFPEIFMDLRDAFCAGNMKEFLRLNEVCTAVVDAFIKNRFLSSLKFIFKKLGLGCGVCREPQDNLSDEKELEPLLNSLREIKSRYSVGNMGFLEELL